MTNPEFRQLPEQPPIPNIESEENRVLGIPEEFKLKLDEPLKDIEREIRGEGYATVYLDGLSHKVSGFAGESYISRNDPKSLQERYSEQGMAKKRTDFWRRGFMQWRPKFQDPELKDFLSPYFKDKIAIELGCGMNGDGYIIADYLKARGYVGVEMRYPASAQTRLKTFEGETPFYVAPGDFSEYLAMLKGKGQKAGVLTMVGVDFKSYKGEIPLNKLGPLLRECLEDDGILITDMAHLLEKDFEEVREVKCPGSNDVLICKKNKDNI